MKTIYNLDNLIAKLLSVIASGAKQSVALMRLPRPLRVLAMTMRKYRTLTLAILLIIGGFYE